MSKTRLRLAPRLARLIALFGLLLSGLSHPTPASGATLESGVSVAGPRSERILSEAPDEEPGWPGWMELTTFYRFEVEIEGLLELGSCERALSASRALLREVGAESGDQAYRGLAYGILAQSQACMLRVPEAIHSARLGVALLREAGEDWQLVLAKELVALSELQFSEGRFPQSLDSLRESLALQERIPTGDPRLYLKTLDYVGRAYCELGDYLSAAETLELALKVGMRRLGPGAKEVAGTLLSLGNIYWQMGRASAAKQTITKAIEIAQVHPELSSVSLGDGLNALGLAYQSLGELEKSEASLNESLDLLEEAVGPRDRRVGSVYNNLGITKAMLGRIVEAKDDFERARRIWSQSLGSFHPDVGLVTFNLGLLYQMLGDLELAQRYLVQGHDILAQSYDPLHPIMLSAQSKIIALTFSMGFVDQALRASEDQMLKIAELWYDRAPALDITELWDFHRGLGLASSVWLNVTAGAQAERAYDALLSGDGLILEQQILRRLALQDASVQEAFDEYQRLTLEYASLLGAEPGEQTDPPEYAGLVAEYRHRLQELGAELERSGRLLGKLSGTLAEGSLRRDVRSAEVASRLSPGEVLVDYRIYNHIDFEDVENDVGEPQLLAFVVHPDGRVARVELGPWAPLREDILRWWDTHHSEEVQRLAPLRDGRARRVAEALWAPLREEVGQPRRLLVSPDRELALLPFAALPIYASGPGLLVDTTEVLLLPSPRIMGSGLSGAAVTTDEGTFLVVSDVRYSDPGPQGRRRRWEPRAEATASGRWRVLRGSRAEGELIAKLFLATHPEQTLIPLRGGRANKGSLMELLPQARWIHFATHAAMDPPDLKDPQVATYGEKAPSSLEDPDPEPVPPDLRSYLVLAGDASAEGPAGGVSTLSAWELSSLDLSGVELAVLSACATAVGRATDGEGLLSLQRALHAAGARSSLTSLWPVDDVATQVFMERFYSAFWEENLPPSTALRQTQRWMQSEAGRAALEAESGLVLDSDGRVHPALWAGWVVAGESGPLP